MEPLGPPMGKVLRSRMGAHELSSDRLERSSDAEKENLVKISILGPRGLRERRPPGPKGDDHRGVIHRNALDERPGDADDFRGPIPERRHDRRAVTAIVNNGAASILARV